MRTKTKKEPIYLTSWADVPVVVDCGYIARIFAISKETARKLCVSGALPAFMLAGRWYINKKDIMIFCGERVIE